MSNTKADAFYNRYGEDLNTPREWDMVLYGTSLGPGDLDPDRKMLLSQYLWFSKGKGRGEARRYSEMEEILPALMDKYAPDRTKFPARHDLIRDSFEIRSYQQHQDKFSGLRANGNVSANIMVVRGDTVTVRGDAGILSRGVVHPGKDMADGGMGRHGGSAGDAGASGKEERKAIIDSNPVGAATDVVLTNTLGILQPNKSTSCSMCGSNSVARDELNAPYRSSCGACGHHWTDDLMPGMDSDKGLGGARGAAGSRSSRHASGSTSGHHHSSSGHRHGSSGHNHSASGHHSSSGHHHHHHSTGHGKDFFDRPKTDVGRVLSLAAPSVQATLGISPVVSTADRTLANPVKSATNPIRSALSTLGGPMTPSAKSAPSRAFSGIGSASRGSGSSGSRSSTRITPLSSLRAVPVPTLAHMGPEGTYIIARSNNNCHMGSGRQTAESTPAHMGDGGVYMVTRNNSDCHRGSGSKDAELMPSEPPQCPFCHEDSEGQMLPGQTVLEGNYVTVSGPITALNKAVASGKSVPKAVFAVIDGRLHKYWHNSDGWFDTRHSQSVKTHVSQSQLEKMHILEL